MTSASATGFRSPAAGGAQDAPSRRALAFLALAIAGLIGQLVIVGVFVAEEGLALGELGDQIFSSTVAALTAADLVASAVVFLVWLPREARRSGIDRWWPFALATLVGLCFSFPLFLYARERRRLDGASARAA